MKLNLLNLNQEMNNPAILRRESRTQDEIDLLNLNQEMDNSAILRTESQTQR
jgi:hypothetical protein